MRGSLVKRAVSMYPPLPTPTMGLGGLRKKLNAKPGEPVIEPAPGVDANRDEEAADDEMRGTTKRASLAKIAALPKGVTRKRLKAALDLYMQGPTSTMAGFEHWIRGRNGSLASMAKRKSSLPDRYARVKVDYEGHPTTFGEILGVKRASFETPADFSTLLTKAGALASPAFVAGFTGTMEKQATVWDLHALRRSGRHVVRSFDQAVRNPDIAAREGEELVGAALRRAPKTKAAARRNAVRQIQRGIVDDTRRGGSQSMGRLLTHTGTAQGLLTNRLGLGKVDFGSKGATMAREQLAQRAGNTGLHRVRPTPRTKDPSLWEPKPTHVKAASVDKLATLADLRNLQHSGRHIVRGMREVLRYPVSAKVEGEELVGAALRRAEKETPRTVRKRVQKDVREAFRSTDINDTGRTMSDVRRLNRPQTPLSNLDRVVYGRPGGKMPWTRGRAMKYEQDVARSKLSGQHSNFSHGRKKGEPRGKSVPLSKSDSRYFE